MIDLTFKGNNTEYEKIIQLVRSHVMPMKTVNDTVNNSQLNDRLNKYVTEDNFYFLTLLY